MADQHEFLLDFRAHAIIVAYAEKQINANAYRPSGDTVGRRHEVVFDGIIQEMATSTRRRSCSSGTASTTSARPAATSPCRRLGTPGNAQTAGITSTRARRSTTPSYLLLMMIWRSGIKKKKKKTIAALAPRPSAST